MITWYIAGPMTGYEDWNYPEFHKAEEKLSAGFPGDTIINPARGFDGDTTLPRETYMRRAFENVLKADRILLLQGWWESKGACAEVIVAAELGLEVWHQDGMSRLLPCPDDLFTDYRRAIAALDSITHHEIAMKYVLPQPGDASPSELRTIASEIRG